MPEYEHQEEFGNFNYKRDRLDEFLRDHISSEESKVLLYVCKIIFVLHRGQRNTPFFIRNTLISNARLKFAKSQAKAKQYPEAKLLLFQNDSLSLSTLSSKNNRRYAETCAKNKCACFNEVA